MILLGILKYCGSIIIDDLTPSSRYEIDKLADEIICQARQSELSRFPRMNFIRGMTSLACLTAKEWVGQIFGLVILLNTRQGWETLVAIMTSKGARVKASKNRTLSRIRAINDRSYIPGSDPQDEENYDPQDEEDDDKGGKDADETTTKRRKTKNKQAKQQNTSVDDDREALLESDVAVQELLHTLEMMLSFEAFLWRGPFWDAHEPGLSRGCERHQAAVRVLMKHIKLYVPRDTDVGYKIQKFHEMLHICRDIKLFGSPANFNEGIGESNLIHFVSNPAETAQLRGSAEYTRQIVRATQERTLVDKAAKAMGIDVKSLVNDAKKLSRCVEDLGEAQFGRELLEDAASNEVGLRRKLFEIRLDLSHDRKKCTASYKHQATKQKGYSEIPVHVERYIVHRFSLVMVKNNIRCLRVQGYSEYTVTRSGGQRMLYRAHPNYASRGSWYNWCHVASDKEHRVAPFFRGMHYYPPSLQKITLVNEGTPDKYDAPNNAPHPKKARKNMKELNELKRKCHDKFGKDVQREYGKRGGTASTGPEPGAVGTGNGHTTLAKILALLEVTNVDSGEVIAEEAVVHGTWRSEHQETEDSVLTRTWVLDYFKEVEEKIIVEDEEQRELEERENDPRLQADGRAMYTACPLTSLREQHLVFEDHPGVWEYCPPHPEVRAVVDRDTCWGSLFAA
jgi:hypothetical protein